MASCRRWCRSTSSLDAARALVGKIEPVAPWDKKEFKIPGGGPYTPATAQVFVMGNAMLRKQSFGNYPAQINLMRAVYEVCRCQSTQACASKAGISQRR